MLLSDTATGGEQVVMPGDGVHGVSVAPTNVDALWISTGIVKSGICEVVATVIGGAPVGQGNCVAWIDPSLNK
jgi:hypothetical protein